MGKSVFGPAHGGTRRWRDPGVVVEFTQPREQLALVQMGVFRGGATLEMAEQVIDAGEDWVEDLLMSLVDQSLLWVRTDSDAPRLTLYESVRAFVGVRFPHPSPELADRFVEAMGQLNAGGRASMASMDEEVVRIRRLEQEASNLWVAQSLARGRSGDSTRWALEAVIWVWSRQGRLVALKDALQEWLDDESVQGLIRLDAQTAWVSQCLHLRDVESPKALLEQLSAQEQGESTDQTYLKTLHPVLEYTLRAGPFSEHIALVESLLKRLQTLSPLVRARLQHTLGIAYRKEGRIEEGVEMQRLALATPGHAHWKPQAQSALAVGLVFLGKTAEAVPEFEAVYDWQNRFGGTLHQIAASTNYGRVCLLSGQFERGWSVLRDGWDKALKLAPIRLCEINGFNYAGSCLITGRDASQSSLSRSPPASRAIDNVDILTTV